jgi:uncharacterized protein with LGFP repeats
MQTGRGIMQGRLCLAVDLNNDGKTDVIWGDGHNYGLYWMEQREPAADGSTNWKIHTIDKKFSQPHTMAWADMNGDGRHEADYWQTGQGTLRERPRVGWKIRLC